jgi:hypothetical protein
MNQAISMTVTVTLLFVLIPATVSSVLALTLTTSESSAWYHQGKIDAIKDFKAHTPSSLLVPPPCHIDIDICNKVVAGFDKTVQGYYAEWAHLCKCNVTTALQNTNTTTPTPLADNSTNNPSPPPSNESTSTSPPTLNILPQNNSATPPPPPVYCQANPNDPACVPTSNPACPDGSVIDANAPCPATSPSDKTSTTGCGPGTDNTTCSTTDKINASSNFTTTVYSYHDGKIYAIKDFKAHTPLATDLTPPPCDGSSACVSAYNSMLAGYHDEWAILCKCNATKALGIGPGPVSHLFVPN